LLVVGCRSEDSVRLHTYVCVVHLTA